MRVLTKISIGFEELHIWSKALHKHTQQNTQCFKYHLWMDLLLLWNFAGVHEYSYSWSYHKNKCVQTHVP